MNNISHIYKNIFISDIYTSCDIDKLKKYNITSILHIGYKNKPKSILLKYMDNDINNMFIKLNDNAYSNVSDCFETSYNYISNISNKQNILIHCTKGISRAPTIVAYYLLRKMIDYMKKKKYQEYVLHDILKLIHLKRPVSNPNMHFISELKKYENNNIHINVSK